MGGVFKPEREQGSVVPDERLRPDDEDAESGHDEEEQGGEFDECESIVHLPRGPDADDVDERQGGDEERPDGDLCGRGEGDERLEVVCERYRKDREREEFSDPHAPAGEKPVEVVERFRDVGERPADAGNIVTAVGKDHRDCCGEEPGHRPEDDRERTDETRREGGCDVDVGADDRPDDDVR